MTAVSVTYLLQSPEGFRLPTAIAYPAGVGAAAVLLVVFLTVIFKRNVGRPVDTSGADSAPAPEPVATDTANG
jgi:hypothetical protein